MFERLKNRLKLVQNFMDLKNEASVAIMFLEPDDLPEYQMLYNDRFDVLTDREGRLMSTED